MRTLSKKRILLSTATIAVFLGLVAWIIPQRKLSVVILNPKFRLLDARISHGTKHELAHANWPITQLSKLLRRAGFNAVVPIQLPPMPENSYALAVRFTGDFAPNALGGVEGELVEASGAVIPISSPACFVSQDESGRNKYGRIWLLASPPTNAVTLRLTHGNSHAPLAEIRIRDL